MKTTEQHLINCLENRLKWYKEAISIKESNMCINGYNYPAGTVEEWKGAVKELKNTLDMIR